MAGWAYSTVLALVSTSLDDNSTNRHASEESILQTRLPTPLLAAWLAVSVAVSAVWALDDLGSRPAIRWLIVVGFALQAAYVILVLTVRLRSRR